MKKEHNFYISIGNTRTTFAIFEGTIDGIKLIKKYTKEFFKEMPFDKIFDELNIIPNEIFVCSVVEYANKNLIKFFGNKKIVFLNHSKQKIINLSLLENPDEIGNDIIASAIYGQSLGKNVTITSLGTATTISHITNGFIMGCIIIPGLEISYNALINETDIPHIKLKYIEKNIGKNTQEALSIGIINGHKFMINEFVRSFHAPNTIYLYFGGNSHYLKFNDWKYVEDMDLLGLYLFSINR